MSGDLSLSQALGGLRIANPDDSDSAPLQQDPQPKTDYTAERLPDNDATIPSSIGVPSDPTPPSQPSTEARRGYEVRYETGQATDSQPHTTSEAPGHNYSHLIAPTDGPSVEQPGSISPFVGPFSTGVARDAERVPVQQMKQDAIRSPAHAVPTRSNSRSVPSHMNPVPSRESSRSSNQGPLPSSSGSLPPRRSSKGMGGGYISSSAVSSTRRDPYGPEEPLPSSSEEWKDRGAAVGVRREVDASGKTVLRHVKKGVRDFNFGRVLGEGSYSTVFLATDRQTLKEYAVKVLEKRHIIREKKIKYVNIEKDTLNRLTEHPGIVRLYYTFQDEASLYYVLDLCNGGELLGVLKKTGTFDIECARFYGAQILDAIEYMHSRGVIHRDLKPENVLLDDNMHVKITDFGTAKLLQNPRDTQAQQGGTARGLPDSTGDADNNSRAASFVGTAEYVSPELLTSKNACKASDLWAFGCIIYQLLAGRPPFKAGTEYLTFQKIVNLDYDFPSGFPAAARDLVERCLVLDPALRLTVEHIKNHEFFDGQAFGKGLWRANAPRLRPYVPVSQESARIQLNGTSASTTPDVTSLTRGLSSQTTAGLNGNSTRPSRIITELPPPTQLDIEWSPVLTRNNERILKLGDLMVISSPLPNSPHGKPNEHGESHKKLSRFFGGSTTKKRQRLVMVTSSGRIVLAPAGGEEKRAKQEISLLVPACTWRTHTDVKGQKTWCVDTDKTHYSFEEPKSSGQALAESGHSSAEEWIEALERARDFALSQAGMGSYGSETPFGDMSSTVSSPASTLGGRGPYADSYGTATPDRSGRNHLSKSQASLDDATPKRNRFSKRQSKNGLGAQF